MRSTVWAESVSYTHLDVYKRQLLDPAGDSVRQALAADTANQLKELGIEVKTEGADWETAYDKP